MDVRRLRADEWERWRDFRRGMLQEAPYAFGTTYAEAAAVTDDEWRRRVERLATSDEQVMYVAEEDGEWLASAGGFAEDGIPNVVSVWTRPEARGRRAAQRAIEAVIAWAGTTGATEIRLWATDTNDAAKRVYARLGFIPTGTVQPLPSDPTLMESEYTRPL